MKTEPGYHINKEGKKLTARFPTLYTKEKAKKIRVGQMVDHRDHVGKFVLAKVIRKEKDILLIHYVG